MVKILMRNSMRILIRNFMANEEANDENPNYDSDEDSDMDPDEDLDKKLFWKGKIPKISNTVAIVYAFVFLSLLTLLEFVTAAILLLEICLFVETCPHTI